MKLRYYQLKGESSLREKIAKGYKKIIFFMATGGGKSANFGSLAHNASLKGNKVIIVMRRRALIFQANEIMKRWGHKVSIIMGNEKGFSSILPIQVCSIDTISRRMKNPKYDFIKKFDVVLVDEAHDTTSPSYRKFFEQFSPKTIFIGFTATPFPVGNKVHDFWETYVKPIEISELIEKGFLVEPKIYSPKKIDVSDIRMMNGDFKMDELFKRVSEMKVIGDIVNEYKERGQNKPAILFAVNKQHSMLMARAFNEAGIPAVHRDESHTTQERDQAINGLKNGTYKILCNVNIFSTGVNIIAEVGIMARPTMSEILYIQQIGRLLRPYKVCFKCRTEYGGSHEEVCPTCKDPRHSYKKQFAIILDHANNTERHGMPDEDRPAVLKKEDIKKKTKKETGIPSIKMCPKCFLTVKNDIKECPDCGHVFVTNRNSIEEEDGKLELVTKERMLHIKIIKRARVLKAQSRGYRWGQGKVEKKLYEEFGNDLIQFMEDLGLDMRFIYEQRKQKLLQGTSTFIKEDNFSTAKRLYRN